MLLRVALATGFLLAPAAAMAQVPPGFHGFVEGKQYGVDSVFCDTKEQGQTLLLAKMQGGVRAFQEALNTLSAKLDDKGEPVCGWGQAPVIIGKQVLEFDGERKEYLIAVEVNKEHVFMLSSWPVIAPTSF